MGNQKLSLPTDTNQNGYNIYGVNSADSGNFEEALKYFNKAIEFDPQNYSAYFNRASIRMHFGDIEGARSDFLECEKLHEKNSYLV